MKCSALLQRKILIKYKRIFFSQDGKGVGKTQVINEFFFGSLAIKEGFVQSGIDHFGDRRGFLKIYHQSLDSPKGMTRILSSKTFLFCLDYHHISSANINFRETEPRSGKAWRKVLSTFRTLVIKCHRTFASVIENRKEVGGERGANGNNDECWHLQKTY